MDIRMMNLITSVAFQYSLDLTWFFLAMSKAYISKIKNKFNRKKCQQYAESKRSAVLQLRTVLRKIFQDGSL